MGTTVWVSEATREKLRRLQKDLHMSSADATINHLLDRPTPDARSIFSRHHKEIREVLERHRLRDVAAFGSRARGDATPTSDLDLVVALATDADPLALLAAEADLEELLRIPVNIIERSRHAHHDIPEQETVPFD